jgi:TRAP-type C4-dicarboxylate transport system permease small subunit
MKAIKWLDDHFEETLLVICLVLISVVCLIQVIIRNIPWIPSLQWAEEFCRFAWIWSVFLSLPYTIRKGKMLRVNVLLDLMPHVIRKTINIIVDIVITGCMGLLGFYSIDVTAKIAASAELSPAMLWPMSIIYGVMLAGYALGTLRGVQMTIIHIMHFGEKELSTIEQTMADAAEEAAAGKRAEGGEA